MESEKLKALEQAGGNYDFVMRLSDQVKNDLKWWFKNLLESEKVFRPVEFEEVIFTDASGSGWGATDGTKSIHGVWNTDQPQCPINYKELYTVSLASKGLVEGLSGCLLLLRIDNNTTISYINRMGGVRYDNYNMLARDIWQSAEERNIRLNASYIPSKRNSEACLHWTPSENWLTTRIGQLSGITSSKN